MEMPEIQLLLLLLLLEYWSKFEILLDDFFVTKLHHNLWGHYILSYEILLT